MPIKNPPVILEKFYDSSVPFELSIDEVGRGCMFGRVYVACVVIPKEPELFNGTNIKDSKKFSSKKKLNEVAEYIKENALTWHIAYEEPKIIDEINILQAVMKGMHTCIKETIIKINNITNTNNNINDFAAIIDGNYFKPYRIFDDTTESLIELPFTTVEKGDATYMGIAAASILAKTARDKYVTDLCDKYPFLDQHYGLIKNVGYCTAKHREGVQNYGITKLHRKTFGMCKTADYNPDDNITEDYLE